MTRARIILLLTVVLLLATAVPPPAAQPRTAVKISVLRAAFVYFTPYVAEAKGFFAKHGLPVEDTRPFPRSNDET